MRHYDFTERLVWSDGFLLEGVARILQDRIPAAERVEKANGTDDRNGTDYWVYRNHSLPPLSVDVKVRSEDYATHGKDDLALETWSVVGEKPGWTRDEKKRTDFILWYWTDTGRFFLVSFPALCEIFSRYWWAWRNTYGAHVQTSGDWQSECVFVPRSVVLEKVNAWSNGNLGPRS